MPFQFLLRRTSEVFFRDKSVGMYKEWLIKVNTFLFDKEGACTRLLRAANQSLGASWKAGRGLKWIDLIILAGLIYPHSFIA